MRGYFSRLADQTGVIQKESADRSVGKTHGKSMPSARSESESTPVAAPQEETIQRLAAIKHSPRLLQEPPQVPAEGVSTAVDHVEVVASGARPADELANDRLVIEERHPDQTDPHQPFGSRSRSYISSLDLRTSDPNGYLGEAATVEGAEIANDAQSTGLDLRGRQAVAVSQPVDEQARPETPSSAAERENGARASETILVHDPATTAHVRQDTSSTTLAPRGDIQHQTDWWEVLNRARDWVAAPLQSDEPEPRPKERAVLEHPSQLLPQSRISDQTHVDSSKPSHRSAALETQDLHLSIGSIELTVEASEGETATPKPLPDRGARPAKAEHGSSRLSRRYLRSR
jgi:hypothetical protein